MSPLLTPRVRRALGGLTAAVLTLAGGVAVTTADQTDARATTPAPHATAHRATAPRLSAAAKSHGLDPAHGAVPGWTHMHVTAQRRTTAASARVAGRSSTVYQPSSTPWPTTSLAVSGMDVSAWSGTVDWNSFRKVGVRYTYVKATEGTYYTNSLHDSQAGGAVTAGLYVGAYHFANPSQSSGAAQADYFVAHGGGWQPGTLPGAVDLEWNPYSGNSCYNMTTAQMGSWITAFQLEYLHKTGTWPVIYTARSWWNTCVGSGVTSAIIAARSDLWVSTLTSTLGTMPASWSSQRIWQYAYVNAGGYDFDRFNGNTTMLAGMAIAGR